MTDTSVRGLDRREHSTPAPDAAMKPDSPTDLDARSWKYVARKAVREFSDDQCTDQAAALTYYAVLALFPAMLALVSLLGVVGQAEEAVDTVVRVMGPLVDTSTIELLEPTLRDMASSQAAGVGLVAGVLGALWSASAYVGAFGRAMNRVYEISEGRPFWKLRPLMVLVTLVAVVMAASVLVMLVVSGPVAQAIGDAFDVGDQAVFLWSILKWPVLFLLVTCIVALLYYATPNVQQPRFRWISLGAAVAIVIWVLASAGFAFYVGNFGSYDKTYGSLAGVVIALLWLWITNIALLLGAEIDSELERGRELQAGLVAEVELQLPVRDSRNIEKAREKELEDIERGRRIREAAEADHGPGAPPEDAHSEDAHPESPHPAGPDPAGPDSRPAAPPAERPTAGSPASLPPPAARTSRGPLVALGAAGLLVGTTIWRYLKKES